ncbi:multisubstrate pseudouridine synthase 7 [Pleosporales sp. CAS-2024a]
MADDANDDSSARPAKRARLDDSSAASLSVCAARQGAGIAPSAAAMDADADADVEREVRAGITEYVCRENLGFTGVLKQRYTDFLVNEIGRDGRVLHLSCTDVPSKEKKGTMVLKEEKGTMVLKEEKGTMVLKEEKENGDTDEAPAEQDDEKLSEEDRNTLHDIFGQDTTCHIVKLVGQIRKRKQQKAKVFKAVIAPPITDKEKRTQAHQCLRRIFPNTLESSMQQDQSLRIKALPPAERKGNNGGSKGGRERGHGSSRDRGQQWDELGGEYLHFNLYKENKDTMEIVGFLGSKIGGGAKIFGFAGTKDRRACTVQRVCVKRQTAERMHSFNKMLYNAAMGDWKYEPYNLRLGDLQGNEFTITLRDCHFQNEAGLDFAQRRQLADAVVGKAISDFSEKGFINYYGLQRFGSFATSTDAIGCKILQDDLQGAVADILAYSETALAAAQEETLAAAAAAADSTLLVSQDDRNRALALHMWQTEGRASAALDILPRKFTAERNVIQHLSSKNSRTGQCDRKADWQGALMTIPRNLLLMYVHAYQSLVWNVVAGYRWSLHGATVVAGDLVLVHDEHADDDKVAASHSHSHSTTNSNSIQPTTDVDANGEFVIHPTGSENANASAKHFERARPLSAAEASSGLYTIWDIVLPQPGFDVVYPPNAVGAFYTSFMASEQGGGLDPHHMRRPWRHVSLSGGYRKLLARPLRPVTYELREYRRVDEEFVTTDLARLRRGEKEKKSEEEEKEEEEEEEEEEEVHGAAEEDKEVGECQNGHDDEQEDEKKKKIAVILRLQLASSQYATMALRELMKAGGVKAYKPEFMGGR